MDSDNRIWWVINHSGITKLSTLKWQFETLKLLPESVYGKPEVYFRRNEDGKLCRALLFKTSERVYNMLLKDHPELKCAYTIEGIHFLVSQ